MGNEYYLSTVNYLMHSEGNMCKPIKEIELVKPIHTKNAIAHYILWHHNLSGMIIV